MASWKEPRAAGMRARPHTQTHTAERSNITSTAQSGAAHVSFLESYQASVCWSYMTVVSGWPVQQLPRDKDAHSGERVTRVEIMNSGDGSSGVSVSPGFITTATCQTNGAIGTMRRGRQKFRVSHTVSLAAFACPWARECIFLVLWAHLIFLVESKGGVVRRQMME